MTNAEMRPNRYARWAGNRRLLRAIHAALDNGQRVTVATHLRATTYDARHRGMFTADRVGVYVARGRRRDDIRYCRIMVTE